MPSTISRLPAKPKLDPRYYQTGIQLGLLLWGTSQGYFAVSLAAILAVLTTALLTQWVFTAYHQLQLNPLSTLNSGFSILLLLHATHWGWLGLAALLAVSSKFLLRLQQRHVFNPSNLGIVLVLLMTDATWVAHGKWGHAIWLALLLAGFGLVVLLGWKQMATSLGFLVTYTLLQLQNGALLIFSFFMLSDPMTTPAKLSGRLLFGGWVAVLASWLQWQWYIPNAFLYALACSSPLVVLINYKFNGPQFNWAIRRTE